MVQLHESVTAQGTRNFSFAMNSIIPGVAIALAALSVWLAVRMINRRERWAKRSLAAISALPVLYFASFGPACWWYSPPSAELEGVLGYPIVLAPEFYWPVGWLSAELPPALSDVVYSYAVAAGDHAVSLPVDSSGTRWVGGQP